MYLAVDIGGTKTLLASFDSEGKLIKTDKFPTDKNYTQFLNDFKDGISRLGEADYKAAGVAIPGWVEHGRGIAFGNLPWEKVPIEADVEAIVSAPAVVENDAKVGALSEALYIIKDFKRVLYVTIGTGIGLGYVHNGVIDHAFSDRGANKLYVEHQGKSQTWESFASGKAIKNRYGRKASEISDDSTWKTIAKDFAAGILSLIAIIDADVVVIGGGVGKYFDRFGSYLKNELKKYETALMLIPPILPAQRPEEAVIYGCYELVKAKYGRHN